MSRWKKYTIITLTSPVWVVVMLILIIAQASESSARWVAGIIKEAWANS